MRLVREAPQTSTLSITELLVVWQQPATRAMLPIGILSFDGEIYGFRYVPRAERIPEFRPLLGFRDFTQVYWSRELFPLFRERVLDPSRPDFERVLDSLSMDPASTTPWEQLVRSGGGSEGDTLQLTPLPTQADGGWACTFLAAGIRHLSMKRVHTESRSYGPYSLAELSSTLDSLAVSDLLWVVPEVGNPYSGNAQLLFADGRMPVGYVPEWLAGLTAPCVRSGLEVSAKVARVSHESAGWHLRLMVDLFVDEPFEILLGRVDENLRAPQGDEG